MEQITIYELEKNIPLLIQKVKEGEEIVVTHEGKAIFKISPVLKNDNKTGFGSGKDDIIFIADDFDETPEDLKEYMP
ncbi:MAG: type II toxin-antitoxin system prevent-host-death family antitoxin [Bacteroidetes bacterium]|nr:type II toxin-antitoxin system prevent-host-death family antitoxin [Bacteroidota bacterium]MBU2584167.1 type II toxin-antitoxin system prevent-host-death family antitoxin [Bacteroidota bacterium]